MRTPTVFWALSFGCAALALAGCDSPPPGAGVAPAPPARSPTVTHAPELAASAATAAPPARPRLDAKEPFLELPLDGLPAAVVSLPLGAESRRPIVIATHGNYDRAEWQCQVWREIVGDRAFVLCPRGTARADSPAPDDIRFTYATNQTLEREIVAGLAALRARFPEHADPGPALYTGFSLGAIMGVPIASRRPAEMTRLVLVEGGHDKWTAATAGAFAAGGGKRVLFVCAQPWCAGAAKRAAAHLEKAGVAARIAHGSNAGHRYDGPVAEETKAALPWVLEGDDRWRGAAP